MPTYLIRWPDQPETVDAEDRGEKGFGYRSSPYRHRLVITPMAADATSPMTGSALASVLSSRVHGDPDTPILRTRSGFTSPGRGLLPGDEAVPEVPFSTDAIELPSPGRKNEGTASSSPLPSPVSAVAVPAVAIAGNHCPPPLRE